MRILNKYLYQELILTLLAVLSVLLLITFGLEVTKLLAMAIEGKIPSSVVLEVLLLKIPSALELILPLSVLLSIMLAIGRLYQDQEMVVLNSCGVGEDYFIKRLLWFLTPVLLFAIFVSLWLAPWSTNKQRLVTMEAQTTAPVAGLVAGRFNNLPNSGGVLYASEINSKAEMQNVWIYNRQRDLIATAPKAKFDWVEEKLALVMLDGYSYGGLQTNQEIVVSRFERLDTFLPELQAGSSTPSINELSTAILWASELHEHRVQLQWRLAMPFSVLLLGLLALKLSKTKPREGRFARMFYAIVIYVLFVQLMLTLKNWLLKGHLPVELGFWPFLLGFLLLVIYPPQQIYTRWKTSK